MSMIERLRHAVESWTWSNAHDADDVAKFIALYDAVEAAKRDLDYLREHRGEWNSSIPKDSWDRIETAFKAIKEAE